MKEDNMPHSSSETNVPVDEWTTGTLKIYHDERIDAVEMLTQQEIKRIDDNIHKLNILLDERSIAQEKAVHAALASAQEAVNKSDAATEKRFEGVNEFRKTLSDQTASFLPRAEYMATHKSVEEKVSELSLQLPTLLARKEYDARHETLTNRVAELADRLNRSEGQTRGSDITMGKIYAAIGAVGAILAIIVMLANGTFN